MPPIWPYTMLQPLKDQIKRVLKFSFTFSLVIKMAEGLFKWLKETSFYERMKEIVIKRLTLHGRKVHI